MKKLMKDKLALNKETLRTLSSRNMRDVQGGGTTSTSSESTSTFTDTCSPTCNGLHC